MSSLAIDLDHVGVRIGTDWLVQDISWQVQANTCAAILGPNGSGKSTLARVLLGQLWATVGHVSVLGHRFGETNLHELRKSIRLVAPHTSLEVDPDMTAIDVVLTGFFGTVNLYDSPTLKMKRRAAELIESVGLTRVKKHRFQTLSSGERMRCTIARALAMQPSLLILDEPASGLDLRAREMILSTIDDLITSHESSLTVLMTTHHLEELPSQISNVLLLDEGKIAGKGKPAEVLKSERLSKVYQCPVKVKKSAGRYFWYIAK